MEWKSYPENLPPEDTEISFGEGSSNSIDVLVFNGKYISMAYLYIYDAWGDGEDIYHQWKLIGPDGYDIEGEVTHWMELPSPPEK
jgi:hypothetical protein